MHSTLHLSPLAQAHPSIRATVQILTIITFVFGSGACTKKETTRTAIELTKANPASLLGLVAEDFTVIGFRLGMTHEEAWQLIRTSPDLTGKVDEHNPSRIYVSATGVQDESSGLLLLLWEPNEAYMRSITVSSNAKQHLAPNFQGLLSMDAVGMMTSERMREFVGVPNRSRISLEIPQIDLKHIAYHYDKIGLEIVHQKHLDTEEVVFSLNESDLSPEYSIEISYSALITATESEDGKLVYPAARFYFGPNTSAESGLTVTAAGEEMRCRQVYQDVAYRLDAHGETGERVPLLFFEACPFTICGRLEVSRKFAMREEKTLKIEKALSNLLWLSADSEFPFGCSDNRDIYSGFEMAVGTRWVFLHAGMTFTAGEQEYLVEKDGATVTFTEARIVMDGVSKKNRHD